jgi:hypothetical protein
MSIQVDVEEKIEYSLRRNTANIAYRNSSPSILDRKVLLRVRIV